MPEDKPRDDRTQSFVPLTNGTIIGHYRIVDKIGVGGMGDVYLAEDTELNRKVALKFLPAHLCQSEDCRARFKREAQAAAKLNHPNIVTIHEVSEFNGRPFFAMEHIEGESLADFIKKHDNSLDKIIDLSIQICEGLNKAHQSGIVHRDIKPSNILIDQDGRAKILDFGLAAIKGSDKLTKTGSTMGTVGYMSPEQVRGEELDHRSDIFSFGVVLYEMITGHAPFKADSEAATLHAIMNTKPELLARFRRKVPAGLQNIVDKALDKDAATRYQHADELSADLRKLSMTGVMQQKPRPDLWNRYVVTSAVAILLIIVGYWAINKYSPSDNRQPESTRKMLAVLPFENLGSPDDEYFADGITDEITGKLATIRELGVISRTSTMQYKKTTKNLQQIAKELGVEYILEGSIRWDKGGDTSHVRILPQLIRVSDDTHLWAETYQRPLTDIFAIQAEIASRIAEVMSISVRESEGAKLMVVPTTSMEAYNAYLRGFNAWTIDDREDDTRFAVQMFERAIAIDSTFALSYAELGIVNAALYNFGHDPTVECQNRARDAAARAIALQPNLARGHVAMAYYYYWCLRAYDQALAELSLAEKEQADDARTMEIKALIWRRQGKFAAAIKHLKMALRLDPRRVSLWSNIGSTYAQMRDYKDADAYLDSLIHMAPDIAWTYVAKWQNIIDWRGDLPMARQILLESHLPQDNRLLYAWCEQYILERNFPAAIEQLQQIQPDTVKIDRSHWVKFLLTGMALGFMNEPGRSHAQYDSARVILEGAAAERPDDHRIHSSLGLVYAGLGRRDDAIREGKLGVDLLPISKDALTGPDRLDDLTIIYIMVGEYDAALDQIEYLLSIPSYISISWLRLDPEYDPLRKLPRFQRLLEKYGT